MSGDRFTMLAYQVTGPRAYGLVDLPVPEPGPGEVGVAPSAVGTATRWPAEHLGQ